MDTFWPGPLTITLPKSDLVPDRATGGLPRVALRCPDHELCRALLERAGVPIAAPSANISGRPSPTTAQDVYYDMKDRISYILDAGSCTIGVESTVVEVHDDKVIILRPGGITKAQLEDVVSTVEYDTALVNATTKPKAPGMKYTHYAPDAPMTVVVGNPDVITTALIIIPLTIALALVLPGNRVLPFADLSVVPFRVAMVVALTRGNLLKNIIIGLVVTASLLWCGSATAPMLTAIAKSVGINLGTSSMLISSFAATSMIQSYLVFIAFAYKPIIGIPVLLLAFAGAWYYFDGIKKVNHEMDEPLKAQ